MTRQRDEARKRVLRAILPECQLSLEDLKLADHLSEETIAYSAKLAFRGALVAVCSNHGTGGPDNIHWTCAATRLAVEEYAEAWAREHTEAGEVSDPFKCVTPLEWIVPKLIAAETLGRTLVDWICRGRTPFRLTDDAPDYWRWIKPAVEGGGARDRRWSGGEDVRAHLSQKYGDKLAVVI